MDSPDLMSRDDLSIDGDVFRVLINEEGQHSLWPAGLKIPDGWTSAGPVGDKSNCLAYVEANWTDLRPNSLRNASAEATSRAS